MLNTFAVADGYVYVGESAGPLPSLYGIIICLNGSNGTQLWSHSYGTSLTSIVQNGGIVYGAGFGYTLSTDVNSGFIFALNASTGTNIWSHLGLAGTRFDYNSLVLAGANLYTLSAVYSEQDASWHSGVYAFNANTGSQLWNYTTSGQFSSLTAAGQSVYVSSTFANTTGYINSENVSGYVYEGGVLALNASNGTRIWNYTTNSYVQTPIVANDTVYAVSGDGNVYAFDASDGRIVWNYTTGSSPGSALIASSYLSPGSALTANNYLYVGSPTGVYCFDASNGAAIWNFTDDTLSYSFGTYPVYADGVIYMGWNGYSSSPLNFYALDASNGQKLWNYTIGYTIQNPPLVAGNTVYIGSGYSAGPGAVIALNSTITLPPPPSPSPTVPEFPSTITLAALFAATAALAAFLKRKKPT